MRLPGFIGPTNETQSYVADQEDTINLYPEQQQDGASSPIILLRSPGVKSIGTAAEVGGRAHFAENGREWAVYGTGFYEIDATGIFTSKGTVTSNANPATISSNGDGGGELFVTSGGNGYIYDLGADTFTQIAALNGIADQGDQIDGYFLALEFANSKVRISELLDGTAWDAAQVFQRSAESDPWVAMKVLNGKYIELFGSKTSEVWYNAGTSPIPFEPHPSGRGRPYGCEAPFSPREIQGQLFWLGRTRNGDGMVLSTTAFAVDRVSKPSIELALQALSRTGDAIGDAYDEAGHTFYHLSVPDGFTFVIDAANGNWHKRGTWISEDRKFVSWRPRFHAFEFGEHRWLDVETADLYRSSNSEAMDVDDRPLRWLRRAPSVVYENQRLFYSEFELLMDVGVGDQNYETALLDTTLFTGATFKAYYELEADGTDQFQASDFTETNGASYVDAYYKKGALLTRASDQYFVRSSGVATDFNPTTDSFSIGCTVRVDALDAAFMGVFVKRDILAVGWELLVTSAGAVILLLNDGSATNLTHSVSLSVDGELHTIVWAVDRTNDVARGTIDGVEDTFDISTLTGSLTNSRDVYIGRSDVSHAGASLDGVIDRVVFVKGLAWTTAQAALYRDKVAGQGVDPQVMLRYSDDGGRTWSGEYWAPAGKAGEYMTRVNWHRLGSARKRVFEVSGSDPVAWRLVDAFVTFGQRPQRMSQVQSAQWGG